jgi:signal peptidase II
VSGAPARTPREAVQHAIARRERRQAHARWRNFGLLAVAALLIDQATKEVVRTAMSPRESIDLLPGFSLTRVNNEGIAFGLFPGRPGLVALLTVVALCAIAAALASLVHRNAVVAAGAGLLVGGSVGNLVDRLVHGAVTDFLDPARWPAFNVADCSITAGAALIVLGLMREAEPDEPGG